MRCQVSEVIDLKPDMVVYQLPAGSMVHALSLMTWALSLWSPKDTTMDSYLAFTLPRSRSSFMRLLLWPKAIRVSPI
jgi:hypothetical protein